MINNINKSHSLVVSILVPPRTTGYITVMLSSITPRSKYTFENTEGANKSKPDYICQQQMINNINKSHSLVISILVLPIFKSDSDIILTGSTHRTANGIFFTATPYTGDEYTFRAA